MRDDEYARRVVDDLRVPAESPRFFDELHERLEADDRRSARRWRRAAFAFAVIALAAIAAAAVIAATPQAAANGLDRTLQCTNLGHRSGGPFFDVTAQPGSPPAHATGELPKLPAGFKPVPAVELVSGESATLLTFSPVVSGYQIDGSRCARSKTSISLAPHGLPRAMTLEADARSIFHVRCAVPRIVVRVRMTSDSEGIPLQAQLLVVRKATSQPLVYVEWARKHVEAYASGTCIAMQ